MKRILSIVLVLALLVAIGAVAVATSNTLTWKDGFGFHCNAAKGNGKVTTGFEKATIGLTRVGTTTTWDLDINVNNECPSCKRIDWVTFSNNNGVINGKNIQVNHSANAVYKATASAELFLIDIVLDCEGNEVSNTGEVLADSKSGVFATNNPAVFTFNIPEDYEIIEGANPVVINFEAKAGQNLYGKVVALRITELPCECEEDDTPGEFYKECEHSWHCPNCIGNGNNQIDQGHKNCVVYCSGNQGNTKFECITCKAQAHSKDVIGGIYCACTLCN